MMKPQRDGYVTVGPLRMYWQEHGAADGALALLLHGGLSTIEHSFTKVLAELVARGHRVVAVEQQAHGRTADVDRALDFVQQASDTAAALARLELGPADVIGYSDGGSVALGLALRHPDRVRRLVTFGTPAWKGGLKPIVDATFAASVKKSPEEVAAEIPKECRDAYAAVAPRPEDFTQLVWKTTEQGATWRGWTEKDVTALDLPYLFAVGDSDIVRLEHAFEVSARMKNVSLAVLPKTDHLALPGNDELPSMIARFLAS